MAPMSLQSHDLTHVKVLMILTIADHLFIHNNILLYKITSKYYRKTYCNGPDRARTRVLLLVCLTP